MLSLRNVVHIEKPEASFAETMNRIRSWLDNHKIEPTEFRSETATAGTVMFNIRFRSEDEAGLFEREFA